MSPAPATRGTSEKFSGNWVKKKLTRGRLHTVAPPPAGSLGSAATRAELGEPRLFGVPAAGRGRGAGNLRLSPRSPGPRYGAQSGTPPGRPCPRARSGWRRAKGRGQRSSVSPARDAPSPKSRPARPGAPQRLPASQALSKDTGATRVPARDALGTATRRSLGRQPSAQQSPALRVRQRRRRETVCAAPPAAPPSSSVENSGAGRADARPAARQAARRPAPEAPPPPPPRARRSGRGPGCGL